MRTPATELRTWSVGVECPTATAAVWLATIQQELEAQGVATISTAQTSSPNQGYVCASVIYRASAAMSTPSAALLVATFTAH